MEQLSLEWQAVALQVEGATASQLGNADDLTLCLLRTVRLQSMHNTSECIVATTTVGVHGAGRLLDHTDLLHRWRG